MPKSSGCIPLPRSSVFYLPSCTMKQRAAVACRPCNGNTSVHMPLPLVVAVVVAAAVVMMAEVNNNNAGELLPRVVLVYYAMVCYSMVWYGMV